MPAAEGIDGLSSEKGGGGKRRPATTALNKPAAFRSSPEDKKVSPPAATAIEQQQQQQFIQQQRQIRGSVSLLSAYTSGSNLSPSATSSAASHSAAKNSTPALATSSSSALTAAARKDPIHKAGRATTLKRQQSGVSAKGRAAEAIGSGGTGASSHLWPATTAAAEAAAVALGTPKRSNDSRNKSPGAEFAGRTAAAAAAADGIASGTPAADSSPAERLELEEQPPVEPLQEEEPRSARNACWALCCCVSATQRRASSQALQPAAATAGGTAAASRGEAPPSAVHGRKLMPASQQPATTPPTAANAAGHAKSPEWRPSQQQQQQQRQAAALAASPTPAAPNASRSVRVKNAAAALSSPPSPSLQQPLSFANSKLQSTRQTVGDPKETVNHHRKQQHHPLKANSTEPNNNNQRSSSEATTGSNLLAKASPKQLLSSKLFPAKKFSSTTSGSHQQHHRRHHHHLRLNSKMADQAVIDKLEAGYAKLQAATPEQCHSLLKKYLTREVLDKNKAKKTAMGASLLDVCQSGFENLDSGVGIYAPDAESYTLFADLFNPIIENYHGGFKATDKHPASDFGDLESLVNVDPDNQFVISTRVRCGRSLQGYPFNPCLTEAQYKEMETKVSGTLKEVEGDLAGTYYPLTGMTKETQQQLIDDHFLFKEGDRFLQAANACRYWPTGRGIYHNKEKTFLVWVNEEDHLRIISMQKGGDLKTVFGRLVRGARAIEAKVPFSRDDRLGFLTFCPTNLGTTIRASVHIKLPKLAADRKKLEEVASRYNLQVRGTSGEHTESVGGVYDISNKRRLGLTEYQAVREMQDGILELIKIEKSL